MVRIVRMGGVRGARLWMVGLRRRKLLTTRDHETSTHELPVISRGVGAPVVNRARTFSVKSTPPRPHHYSLPPSHRPQAQLYSTTYLVLEARRGLAARRLVPAGEGGEGIRAGGLAARRFAPAGLAAAAVGMRE